MEGFGSNNKQPTESEMRESIAKLRALILYYFLVFYFFTFFFYILNKGVRDFFIS